MTTALRPLSTGELLDRTFSLYRSHFGLFVGIFAIPHLVSFAFQCLGVALQSPVRAFQVANIMSFLAWTYGALFLSMILTAVSQAATVVAVSDVHLERPASVMDSYERVKTQLFGVIAMSLLINVAVFVACLALIVPGVLLFLMWSLAVPVKVLESKGIFDAMSRSMELTKGSRGRIFVIWVLFFVLNLGVSWLLQWPILAASGAASSRGGVLQSTAAWQVASHSANFISQCLVGPIGTIAFSLVYYDQRVRKEAFDLQLMMSTIDAATVPSSPAQVGA
jgi:hypothetical protein